ncbi:crotonobetainyl-CoA:carnitine CoA-transferase CaiB-like acyl-CoA transferase [Inhella inkyongensis]|uniref:Crotonobetainyl-CoA:carnitine CoA-transferase CaiB-like acyl-CoA transferase n=1 Tax=Inhella inkyongensis TaxID=392593 RepID=A0A840S524_9BURK|nr:CoA transferase [Inhella inkyongensis]MBB5206427.1 crotonobetainyl-CoA:carnitine CoA-transferase CaiB-like acyl-CoA transferase [Inhella inkyongensis]
MAALRGLRLLSLGLNLPAPLALQRCVQLGAKACKVEPPDGDLVARVQLALYASLHRGVRVLALDLKSAAGQRALARELARADVLLTSFRPSALRRLGLSWAALRREHPGLWQVRIVGAAGVRAEESGHDLCYQAEQGLVQGLQMPTSLLADLGGAQMAVQAVFEAALGRAQGRRPRCLTVSLGEAAEFAAQPLRWGLTAPGGLLGGGHAGYAVYACADGRVAVAALEPHFAQRLAAAAGLMLRSPADWMRPATHVALRTWMAGQSKAALLALAHAQDWPLVVCPDEEYAGA